MAVPQRVPCRQQGLTARKLVFIQCYHHMFMLQIFGPKATHFTTERSQATHLGSRKTGEAIKMAKDIAKDTRNKVTDYAYEKNFKLQPWPLRSQVLL